MELSDGKFQTPIALHAIGDIQEYKSNLSKERFKPLSHYMLSGIYGFTYSKKEMTKMFQTPIALHAIGDLQQKSLQK